MTPGRYPLRRPQPVEPGRTTGPLRIAEVRGAASERVGAHGSPGWVGEIGGGFHDDGEVGCPGDREPELVGADAEVWACGEDQGVRERPDCGRAFAESRAPAGGAWLLAPV